MKLFVNGKAREIKVLCYYMDYKYPSDFAYELFADVYEDDMDVSEEEWDDIMDVAKYYVEQSNKDCDGETKWKLVVRGCEMKNFFNNAVTFILSLPMVWVLASWFNIILHNTTDYVYWKYNFFVLLIQFGDWLNNGY